MLSRAEIRRRKQQSVRDKARYREEQEELERRRRQSFRDRQRQRAEQPMSLWGSPSYNTFGQIPASVIETTVPRSESMAPKLETTVLQSERIVRPKHHFSFTAASNADRTSSVNSVKSPRS